MKRAMSALGLIAAGVYLVLAVAATVCPLDHAASRGVQHHHASGVLQSVLCAWACQANPAPGLTASTPLAQPAVLVLVILQALSSLLSSPSQLRLAARAPPR